MVNAVFDVDWPFSSLLILCLSPAAKAATVDLRQREVKRGMVRSGLTESVIDGVRDSICLCSGVCCCGCVHVCMLHAQVEYHLTGLVLYADEHYIAWVYTAIGWMLCDESTVSRVDTRKGVQWPRLIFVQRHVRQCKKTLDTTACGLSDTSRADRMSLCALPNVLHGMMCPGSCDLVWEDEREGAGDVGSAR